MTKQTHEYKIWLRHFDYKIGTFFAAYRDTEAEANEYIRKQVASGRYVSGYYKRVKFVDGPIFSIR